MGAAKKLFQDELVRIRLILVVMLMLLREIGEDTSWWRASILQGELLAFEDEVRELLGRAREMAREVPGTSV